MSLKARLKDNKTTRRCGSPDQCLCVLGPDLGSLGGGGAHICVCENTCIHVHKDAKGPPWMTFLMSHPCYLLMQGLSLT